MLSLRCWIVRVTVKGQKNRKGAPLRKDFGLGNADLVTLPQARERAPEYRNVARKELSPRYHIERDVPSCDEIAQQVHIRRLPTWKYTKHARQWISILHD